MREAGAKYWLRKRFLRLGGLKDPVFCQNNVIGRDGRFRKIGKPDAHEGVCVAHDTEKGYFPGLCTESNLGRNKLRAISSPIMTHYVNPESDS